MHFRWKGNVLGGENIKETGNLTDGTCLNHKIERNRKMVQIRVNGVPP